MVTYGTQFLRQFTSHEISGMNVRIPVPASKSCLGSTSHGSSCWARLITVKIGMLGRRWWGMGGIPSSLSINLSQPTKHPMDHPAIPFFQGHGERIGARQHRQLFRLGVEAWCEASWTSRRRLDDPMGGFHWAINRSNQHRYGKPMVSQGTWSTNAGFSMVFCIFLHNIHVTMSVNPLGGIEHWLFRVFSIVFFKTMGWHGVLHGFLLPQCWDKTKRYEIAELKDLQDDFEEKKQKLKKRGTLTLVCIKLFTGDWAPRNEIVGTGSRQASEVSSTCGKYVLQ